MTDHEFLPDLQDGTPNCRRCGLSEAEHRDYRGFRIKEIHAIVGIDTDDEEGVAAVFTPDGPLPLIASDKVRLEQLKVMAQTLADETGLNFKIARFTVREDIGEIRSRKAS